MLELNVSHLIKREGIHPGKEAVVFQGKSRTYGELKDRAFRFANGLQSLGVEKGDRVAVLLHNCLEFWEINFGIYETGAIVVPLNSRLSSEEIMNLTKRSNAKVIVYSQDHIQHIDEIKKQGNVCHYIYLGDNQNTQKEALNYESLIQFAEAKPLNVSVKLDDPAEIIYTSGTTGIAKGVVWTHGSILWNSIQQCMDYNITSNDKVYVVLGMHYIGGRHDFTFPVFHQGGTVHIRKTGQFNIRETLQYIEDNNITTILLVPVMLYDMHELPNITDYNLNSLRMIMCGGAPVPISIIEKTMKICPKTDFIQVYGSTEVGGTVTALKKEDSIKKIGSCGKATLHNEIKIIDDKGNALPYGKIGEIAVKGPSVMKEYWENPELTQEVLKDGWLYTGDLGRFDKDGYLYIVGRKKDMIISGGMNIYPEEIEVLLKKHKKIHDAAVIGVPDERWGESVLAIVQLKEGESMGEEEVITYCRSHLASFKKPKSVEFTHSFPRTQSGKIIKQQLKQTYLPKYESLH